MRRSSFFKTMLYATLLAIFCLPVLAQEKFSISGIVKDKVTGDHKFKW